MAPSDLAPAAPRIVSAGPEDRAEQALLFNACFKKSLGERELAWRYDRSPHGPSLSFVARPAGGAAVSGYASSPRFASVGGDPASLARIGQTGDVMTHPQWRKRGLFSDLDRAAREAARDAGWPLMFGLPNRRSAHIFLELGWEAVGTVRPWTAVLRVDRSAWAQRVREGRARALALPLERLWAARARRRLVPHLAGLAPRMLPRFPREVTELSQEVGRRFGLMVRRDADYLTWRFLRGSAGLHRCLGLYAADGSLAAYVVVQLPREGSFVGYLVDLLARDEVAVEAALELGLACLESSSASVVEATAIDGSWWSERLAGAGFRPPKPSNFLILILYPLQADHPLVAAAREPARWYFTDGDRDDETMG